VTPAAHTNGPAPRWAPTDTTETLSEVSHSHGQHDWVWHQEVVPIDHCPAGSGLTGGSVLSHALGGKYLPKVTAHDT
jgi:hypothetical protein